MVIIPSREQECRLRLDMVLGCWKLEEEPIIDLNGHALELSFFLIGHSKWVGTIGKTSSSWIKLLFIPISIHGDLVEHHAYSVYLHGKAKEELVFFLSRSKKGFIKTSFLGRKVSDDLELKVPVFREDYYMSNYYRNLLEYYQQVVKLERNKIRVLLTYNSGFKISLQ